MILVYIIDCNEKHASHTHFELQELTPSVIVSELTSLLAMRSNETGMELRAHRAVWGWKG